jgi:hypothetical protein
MATQSHGSTLHQYVIVASIVKRVESALTDGMIIDLISIARLFSWGRVF